MHVEFRAITNRDGTPRPFYYIFDKPDVNWGGYFHNLRAHEVLWWEFRTLMSDGSSTAWQRVEARP